MRAKIEIYSSPTCSDCKEAKQFLNKHNLSFTEYDLSRQTEKTDELKKLTGKQIVPTLVIDGKTFIGFAANQGDIEQMLLPQTS